MERGLLTGQLANGDYHAMAVMNGTLYDPKGVGTTSVRNLSPSDYDERIIDPVLWVVKKCL
jgi:hypothetical protein